MAIIIHQSGIIQIIVMSRLMSIFCDMGTEMTLPHSFSYNIQAGTSSWHCGMSFMGILVVDFPRIEEIAAIIW